VQVGVGVVQEAVAGRLLVAVGRSGLVDEPRDSEWLGHAQAIWLDPVVRAGSDRRADGTAIVDATDG
jgi:hypothetical protein